MAADAALVVELQSNLTALTAGIDKAKTTVASGAESFQTLATAGTESLAQMSASFHGLATAATESLGALRGQIAGLTERLTVLEAKLATTAREGGLGQLAGRAKGAAEGLQDVADRGGLLSGVLGGLGGPVGLVATAAAGLGEHLMTVVQQERNAADGAGMSIETFDELRQTFIEAGVPVAALARVFPRMADNIRLALEGSKEQVSAFRDLGISADFLKTHATDTSAVLFQMADRIHQTGIDAMTSADLYHIFGGRATQLAGALARGSASLRESMQAAQGHARAVKNAVDTADEFTRTEHTVVDTLEEAVLPAFKIMPPIIAAAGTAVELLGATIRTVLVVAQAAVAGAVIQFKALGAVIDDVAHGRFAAARADIKAGSDAFVISEQTAAHDIASAWTGSLERIKAEWRDALTPPPHAPETAAPIPHQFATRRGGDRAARQAELTAAKIRRIEQGQVTSVRKIQEEFAATQDKADLAYVRGEERKYTRAQAVIDKWLAKQKQAIVTGLQQEAAAERKHEVAYAKILEKEAFDADRHAQHQVSTEQRTGEQLIGEVQRAQTTMFGWRNFFAEKANKLIATGGSFAIRALASNLAVKMGLNQQEKKSDASTAAAGAGKSVASIPLVGAFLAPVTAASVFSALMAFEKGGIVPETALAMVHKNEMVLPASIAAEVRRAASGSPAPGGAGDVHLHYTSHVSALDARGVSDVLQRHSGDVAAALQRYFRAKNRG